MNRTQRLLCLTAALLFSPAFAQSTTPTPTTQPAAPTTTVSNTTVTLPNAVKTALPLDASVKTAQANLLQAQAANTASQADPSVLVAARLSAAHAVTQAQAQLKDAQLTALQTTIQNYTALLEAQENTALQTFQVQVLTKNLEVAQVKLTTGNATTLDVQNAQNSLAGGQQNLAAAQAALNLASAKLGTQLGVSAPRASGAPEAPKLTTSVATLQTTADQLTNLVTANNSLALAQLNVKLASNDFTPVQTLQQAQTALANAQRTLSSAQQNTSQAISAAYQNALNATAQLEVAQSKADAAQKQYDQDNTRLQSGTIAATDLQSSQLTLRQAQFALLQAKDSVLNSLAALSVASGQNLTGIALP